MKMVTITIHPQGKQVAVPKGSALQDVLFDFGVEFPCGGEGSCGQCRVKVLAGDLALNDVQRAALSADEIRQGWRLACQCRVESAVTLEINQWTMAILGDKRRVKARFREGYGVAVDVGTTTLVAELVDLSDGRVLGVKADLNPQARYGADIMSRIEYATRRDGLRRLQALIREKIGLLIRDLIREAGLELQQLAVVLVGNTVMHNLFCGVDVEPLSRVPFRAADTSEHHWKAAALDWPLAPESDVTFLPCIGGFVGSDILAGILAIDMYASQECIGLVDLGTNGEVVIGSRERIFCASTAAGPAFEAARIQMGMRATTGAIHKVTVKDGHLAAHILGHTDPRGICGSGLVDAVAGALQLGYIDPSGRIHDGMEIMLRKPVKITQQDVRELQLAKGAIAAGFDILLRRCGIPQKAIERIYVAGAFGNYVNLSNAQAIGLLNFSEEILDQAGNTALRGAKRLLFGDIDYQRVLSGIEHISLADDSEFQEIFVENMRFPA